MKKVLVGILGKDNVSEEDIHCHIMQCFGKTQFIINERKP